MPNEADTCRRFITPKLQSAGWDSDPHRLSEQVTFTDGRIIMMGNTSQILTPGLDAQSCKNVMLVQIINSITDDENFFVNLDIKNPRAATGLEHLSPDQLADDIIAKESRILEIMHEIKQCLAGVRSWATKHNRWCRSRRAVTRSTQ